MHKGLFQPSTTAAMWYLPGHAFVWFAGSWVDWVNISPLKLRKTCKTFDPDWSKMPHRTSWNIRNPKLFERWKIQTGDRYQLLSSTERQDTLRRRVELARASIDLRLSHENFSNLVVGVGDCGLQAVWMLKCFYSTWLCCEIIVSFSKHRVKCPLRSSFA